MSTEQKENHSVDLEANLSHKLPVRQSSILVDKEGNPVEKHGVINEEDLVDDIKRSTKQVLMTMVFHATETIQLPWWDQFLRGMLGGSYIAFGAALSIFLAQGVEQRGIENLMMGIGFSVGFGFVILTGAALMTEINMSLPVALMAYRRSPELPIVFKQTLKFWVVVVAGNLLGGILVGAMMHAGGILRTEEEEGDLSDQLAIDTLTKVVRKKLRDSDRGAAGWWTVVASGMLGNWLVGIAAANATAARTIVGKVVGIFLPVLAFVALGAQHGPANVGYFAIALIRNESGIDGGDVIGFNLIPSFFGNLLGAVIFDAAAMFIIFLREIDEGMHINIEGEAVPQLSDNRREELGVGRGGSFIHRAAASLNRAGSLAQRKGTGSTLGDTDVHLDTN